MKLVNNHTIGADIEMFLWDKDAKEVVSAEGYIKGSKHEPFQWNPESPYYGKSLDNVMVEFTIPPVTTPKQFFKNISIAREYIASILPSNLIPLAIPAARLNEKYLQTENAQLFGCEPDFNAWTEQQNPAPNAIGNNLRSAGGHIHTGYDNPSEFVNMLIIKAYDLHIGVPSVIMEPENERKQLYGKAGAFRHKPYGVEYRSLSNYYLESKELTEWVVSQAILALDFVNESKLFSMDEADIKRVQDAINTNNKRKARYLINKYELNTIG